MIRFIERPDFALEWCRKLGASPDTLEPLQGGINNQVFRCNVAGSRFVIKGYSTQRPGDHDRFQAELRFLRYAYLVAADYVPNLLGFDPTSRSLVLESLEGDGFREGARPSDHDLVRAVTFMRRLNADIELARVQIDGRAAEGFLLITEHLQNIEQRLTRMSLEHIPRDLKSKAQTLLDKMRRRLLCLKEATSQALIKNNCHNALNFYLRCISPGDFGFHNAIRTPRGVRFFDFEFAGWDDPTKTVSDFDLQPRVQLKPRSQVLSTAVPGWGEDLQMRYAVLFPILELKWACIILAVLNPEKWMHTIAREDNATLRDLLQSKFRLAQIYLPED